MENKTILEVSVIKNMFAAIFKRLRHNDKYMGFRVDQDVPL